MGVFGDITVSGNTNGMFVFINKITNVKTPLGHIGLLRIAYCLLY